jgi:hypothetical protein
VNDVAFGQIIPSAERRIRIEAHLAIGAVADVAGEHDRRFRLRRIRKDGGDEIVVADFRLLAVGHGVTCLWLPEQGKTLSTQALLALLYNLQ